MKVQAPVVTLTKSIPKTGNGKNTERCCTTYSLTKMQKTV